jgi:hypothetical protein
LVLICQCRFPRGAEARTPPGAPKLISFPVPKLTRRRGIKLNERVPLRGRAMLIRSPQPEHFPHVRGP